MTAPQILINVALAEVGYMEKASNSQLDDKTANAGAGNWTKYARDLDVMGGFYNGNKNGYDWCDVFVDWCFVQAFGRQLAQQLTGQPDKSYGAGVNSSANYYKALDRLHYVDPLPGDQVFFLDSSDGLYYHTGIVKAVDSDYLYTIEGNTSNQVAERRYSRTDRKLGAYGRPDWSLVDGAPQPEFVTYIVTAEDTLTSIAQQFGVTQWDIVHDNLLIPGNEIRIRTSAVIPPSNNALAVGDRVRLTADALVWGKSYPFSSWAYNTDMIVRQFYQSEPDRVAISTSSTGPYTGTVDRKYLIKV